MKKPSDRIKEIWHSIKVLAGQDPNDKSITFWESAILKYLDEEAEKKAGISQ